MPVDLEFCVTRLVCWLSYMIGINRYVYSNREVN